MAAHTTDSRKIMITGLANSGKTQIFNNLTGDYNVVANYPMTTLEQAAGSFTFRGMLWQLLDTPGINTLQAESSEALVFRRSFIREQPDIILQCIDANRLRQSLRLTAELLELGLPMVLSLNVIDETAKRGVRIDPDMLSRLLGLPVVETVASEGLGMYDLKEAFLHAEISRSPFLYSGEVKDVVDALEAHIPLSLPYRHKIAVLSLMDDPQLLLSLPGKLLRSMD